MMDEPLSAPPRPESQAATHIVHALLQFTLAVKHRKSVVMLCTIAALLLGALYYATATRYYAAEAELFVIASGDDTRSTGLSEQGRDGTNLLPTFERLITSAKVVHNAIERLRPEDRIDLAEVPEEKWVATIQKNLTAKAVYGTNNIEVQYLSRDPGAAVSVVTEILNSYHEFMDVVHKGTAEDLIRGLQQQQAQISEQLNQWQRLLEEKKAECGDILGTGAESRYLHPAVEKLISINKERATTMFERIKLAAQLENVESTVARGGDLKGHVLAVADSVGREVLMTALGLNTRDSASLAEMEKNLLSDRAELAGIEKHLGLGHPKVEQLNARIRQAEQFLASFNERIGRRLDEMQGGQLGQILTAIMRQQVTEAQYKERLLEQEAQTAWAEAGALSGQFVEIQALEHNVEWYRGMHDKLLDRLTNLDMAVDGPIIRTQRVSEPVRASTPASPNLRRVALMALIAGLGLGLAAVYVLDTLDDRFRSVEELQSQTRVPVMAIVYQLPRRETAGIPSLQLLADPDAPESEAFRTLRTSLALSNEPTGRIVVTSAEPGDGKTTVLANTAVACAKSGRRTLLVDADLRRPGLTALLGYRGAEGLSAMIRSQEPVEQTAPLRIRRTEVPLLDVLPSGPRPANPAELLAGPKFSELLAWAEAHYDQILIDSPPILATSDTAIIGRLVDGVLLVVQPLKNKRRLVLRAAENLALLKIPLVGVVANRIGGAGGHYAYGGDYAVGYGADPDQQPVDELDGPPEPSGQRDRLARADQPQRRAA